MSLHSRASARKGRQEMHFEEIFKKENRQLCRMVGVVLTLPFVLAVLGRVSMGESEGLTGWFREWFTVVICAMFFFGAICLAAGFFPRRGDDE